VLICVGRWPDSRTRDIAKLVDIAERRVLTILRDLEQAGYLARVRAGRRNHYEVDRKAPFRHRFENQATVGELLDLFSAREGDVSRDRRAVRLVI
jgi:predicted transcriptional regulator